LSEPDRRRAPAWPRSIRQFPQGSATGSGEKTSFRPLRRSGVRGCNDFLGQSSMLRWISQLMSRLRADMKRARLAAAPKSLCRPISELRAAGEAERLRHVRGLLAEHKRVVETDRTH